MSDISPENKDCLYENTNNEIHVLLGADFIGELLQKRIVYLSCGLVATDSVLGWTVMRRLMDNNNHKFDNYLLTLSPHMKEDKNNTYKTERCYSDGKYWDRKVSKLERIKKYNRYDSKGGGCISKIYSKSDNKRNFRLNQSIKGFYKDNILNNNRYKDRNSITNSQHDYDRRKK